MDPETLRAEMPPLAETAYLNTGAGSPSPQRVVDATAEALTYHQHRAPAGDGMYHAVSDAVEAARRPVAEFLGADPQEIAFVHSTSDGIGMLASTADLDAGDVVVRTDLEHPAGCLPWAHLAETRDVEVRVLETDAGRLSMDEMQEAVDGAALVCLSSLTWTHGTRLPVGEVVDVAHDAGARVLVDAVQSIGQVPVDVEEWGADFVVGAGHKWLLGPWGAGFVYVDLDAVEWLSPQRIGYASVEDSGAAADTFERGAARFEVGTQSPLPLAGLVEAVETIEALGFGTIRDRIERLTDRLTDGLDDDRLRSPREFESGLVSFRVDDPEATVERLDREGVVIRSLPFPRDTVRASVHVFNTAADVDALLDAL